MDQEIEVVDLGVEAVGFVEGEAVMVIIMMAVVAAVAALVEVVGFVEGVEIEEVEEVVEELPPVMVIGIAQILSRFK